MSTQDMVYLFLFCFVVVVWFWFLCLKGYPEKGSRRHWTPKHPVELTPYWQRVSLSLNLYWISLLWWMPHDWVVYVTCINVLNVFSASFSCGCIKNVRDQLTRKEVYSAHGFGGWLATVCCQLYEDLLMADVIKMMVGSGRVKPVGGVRGNEQTASW